MRVLAGSICTGFLLLCIAGCGGASSTDEVPSKDTKAGEQSSRLPPKTLAPADEAAVAGQPSKNSSGALPGGTVDLRFVPKQALAALVMYPSRFLGRPPIAKVNMKEALAELEAELGVPVSEIEQLVTMFVLIPAGDPDEGHPALDMAFEMRLARPHDGTALAKKVIQPGPPEKAEIAGKAYFRPNSKGPTRAYQKAVYVIDERTFLCGDEAAIKAILSGGPATTPLTELLAKVDPAADLTVVSTGNDRLTKAREYFGPPIQAFAGVAHALGADYGAMASTTLSPNMSLKFTLFAQDNAAPERLPRSCRKRSNKLSPSRQCSAKKRGKQLGTRSRWWNTPLPRSEKLSPPFHPSKQENSSRCKLTIWARSTRSWRMSWRRHSMGPSEKKRHLLATRISKGFRGPSSPTNTSMANCRPQRSAPRMASHC